MKRCSNHSPWDCWGSSEPRPHLRGCTSSPSHCSLASASAPARAAGETSALQQTFTHSTNGSVLRRTFSHHVDTSVIQRTFSRPSHAPLYISSFLMQVDTTVRQPPTHLQNDTTTYVIHWILPTHSLTHTLKPTSQHSTVSVQTLQDSKTKIY